MKICVDQLLELWPNPVSNLSLSVSRSKGSVLTHSVFATTLEHNYHKWQELTLLQFGQCSHTQGLWRYTGWVKWIWRCLPIPLTMGRTQVQPSPSLCSQGRPLAGVVSSHQGEDFPGSWADSWKPLGALWYLPWAPSYETSMRAVSCDVIEHLQGRQWELSCGCSLIRKKQMVANAYTREFALRLILRINWQLTFTTSNFSGDP